MKLVQFSVASLGFFFFFLSLTKLNKILLFQPTHMERMSGYSLSDLKPCVKHLFSQYTRKDEMAQKAVIEKYKDQK